MEIRGTGPIRPNRKSDKSRVKGDLNVVNLSVNGSETPISKKQVLDVVSGLLEQYRDGYSSEFQAKEAEDAANLIFNAFQDVKQRQDAASAA